MKIFCSSKTNLTNLSVRSSLILGLVAVLFSLSIIPALACAAQPPPSAYPTYTLKERISLAPYVFSGTITDIKYGETAVATVKVQSYFKGSGPATVKISGFSSGADCQEMVNKGQQAVFFTFGDATTTLKVTSKLDPSKYVKPTDPLTDQFVSQVKEATGQEPIAPLPGTANQAGSPANINLAIGYLLLAGGPVLIFGGLLVYLLIFW
jgi:hypothetical protein